MSAGCCAPGPDAGLGAYRRVLWAALAINVAMFVIEMAAGVAAGSSALQADALDFLGDAGNYILSLAVIGLGLRQRARSALVKGATMGAFGLWVAGSTTWHAIRGTVPDATTIGAVGVLALAANASVLALLWSYRRGDADMRSVWLCSRNDVVANLAVIAAALGVAGTGSGWPDYAVAAIIAGLALQGSWLVTRGALAELRRAGPPSTVSVAAAHTVDRGAGRA